MRRALLALLGVLAAASGHAASPLEVTNVRHEPAVFDPAEGERVAIRFHLSRPAAVKVQVYDGRDLRIRTLGSSELLPAGDAQLTWDGRDEKGRLVPPEAYPYTVQARSEDGRTVEHDVTDRTRGDPVRAKRVRWDSEAERIRYVLPEPARVAVRVGLEQGGPLLGTVLEWVPRAAGEHAEAWDGRDASGVLDLSEHPELAVGVRAFSLPANAVLVGPPPREVELLSGLPEGTPRREEKWSPPPRVHDHAQQPIEERGDVPITLEPPSDLPTNEEGIPVVEGPVPLRLDVAPEERGRAWRRRFEVSFFVDGTFVYENETGYLPLTWRWDPTGASAGEHFVTANFRGYEGNFGAATVRLWVAEGRADEPPEGDGSR